VKYWAGFKFLQMKKILILGGSGMIGSDLSLMLIDKSYEVVIFSRNKEYIDKMNNNIKIFYWDIKKNIIDISALNNIYCIINLAGANIGSNRWTINRKKEIIESRIQPLDFLLKKCIENKISPKILISSSAVGYYGTNTSDTIFSERTSKGNDFLADVCSKWEQKAKEFEKIGSRVVNIRTAVVLSLKGGVFKKILPLAKLGINGLLGSGNQYFPWVHILDICRLYIFCMENEKVSGIYNGVSTEFVTNKDFTIKLSKAIGYMLIMPTIPRWVLKLFLGEMSILLLEGSRISNRKIKDIGFVYQYDELEFALRNLLQQGIAKSGA
jgi:uncharacterized protein (TIGR01777 family)